MTVLIKGMEMPKTCQICRAARFDRIVDCSLWQRVRSVSLDKHRNCPLIEVPTPHGRLIDADEFFDKIPPGDIEHDEKISRTGAIADVCTWILSAPTVIEAEEGE